jgi:ACR3 family arsenite transporter
MAALGILFFRYLFAGLVPEADASQNIAGMILLGVAACTAMVFVWSHLTNGNANYTLVRVSVNDLMMMFAFAPICVLLLGVSDISVPWETLVASTVIFVVIPRESHVCCPTPVLQHTFSVCRKLGEVADGACAGSTGVW